MAAFLANPVISMIVRGRLLLDEECLNEIHGFLRSSSSSSAVSWGQFLVAPPAGFTVNVASAGAGSSEYAIIDD